MLEIRNIFALWMHYDALANKAKNLHYIFYKPQTTKRKTKQYKLLSKELFSLSVLKNSEYEKSNVNLVIKLFLDIVWYLIRDSLNVSGWHIVNALLIKP